MTRRKSRRNAQRIQNVRITDDYAGSDNNKVERMIGSLQNSHSQTRLMCSDCFTIAIPTGNTTNAILAGSQIRLFDDFASIIAQFETYRIKAIRFDIYDVNPNSTTVGFFGTFHDEYSSTSQPTFTASEVVDSPDGQLVAPGTGKLTLTWMAKGTRENDFVSTASNIDFGGLRYAIAPATTAVANKYQVYCKAIVDFRGRK